MEKMQWRQQQELAEVKHNADLVMMEVRQSMEAEKQKVLSDFKKQAEMENHKAISDTKKKQWCANCGKEAIFYCCWNTSYCDYPCQVRYNFSGRTMIFPVLSECFQGSDFFHGATWIISKFLSQTCIKALIHSQD